MARRKITAKWLREQGACEDEVLRFEAEWPNGAPITEANCLRGTAMNLDVRWFAKRWLEGQALAAYDAAVAPAHAAYDAALASAHAAFHAAVASAHAAVASAYAAVAPALAADDAALARALTADDAAVDQALAADDAAVDQAEAAFDKAVALAFWRIATGR